MYVLMSSYALKLRVVAHSSTLNVSLFQFPVWNIRCIQSTMMMSRGFGTAFSLSRKLLGLCLNPHKVCFCFSSLGGRLAAASRSSANRFRSDVLVCLPHCVWSSQDKVKKPGNAAISGFLAAVKLRMRRQRKHGTSALGSFAPVAWQIAGMYAMNSSRRTHKCIVPYPISWNRNPCLMLCPYGSKNTLRQRP